MMEYLDPCTCHLGLPHFKLVWLNSAVQSGQPLRVVRSPSCQDGCFRALMLPGSEGPSEIAKMVSSHLSAGSVVRVRVRGHKPFPE